MIRTDPTLRCDITLAASARLEPGDIVTSWVLMVSPTVAILTTSFGDRYSTPWA
jgi:hypothetical protein